MADSPEIMNVRGCRAPFFLSRASSKESQRMGSDANGVGRIQLGIQRTYAFSGLASQVAWCRRAESRPKAENGTKWKRHHRQKSLFLLEREELGP